MLFISVVAFCLQCYLSRKKSFHLLSNFFQIIPVIITPAFFTIYSWKRKARRQILYRFIKFNLPNKVFLHSEKLWTGKKKINLTIARKLHQKLNIDGNFLLRVAWGFRWSVFLKKILAINLSTLLYYQAYRAIYWFGLVFELRYYKSTWWRNKGGNKKRWG